MLVGREAEQRVVEAVLQSAREERSAALVVRGEPGIGKSALLSYAADSAADMRLLRCVGIEAEHELPFAGMHQLVRPCLDLVGRLPDPQAAALRGALGLSFDGVNDRFLVSVGLLSLLAEACDDGPVLCCIDDAQWLDQPSAEALVFAARRFQAEPIALLMTVREGEARRFDAPGVPELELEGLSDAEARALLTAQLDRAPAPDVVATLLSTAHGNPLALMELPAALSEAQLDGAEPILGPPPVRGAVEAAFGARVERLPEATRRVLLLAAADDAGDIGAVERAAGQLGLAVGDLGAAERDGLVRVDGGVVFRHPLVRSVIYRAATHSDRRAAHEALAAVVDDPMRGAWHRALVTDGPDEAIAAELEQAGTQAVTRAAHATAVTAFERAAELSDDPTREGHRLCCAAQAALDAGRLDAAIAFADRARPLVVDPIDGAQLSLIRGANAARRGSPVDTHTLLREAAVGLTEVAPDLAMELLLWSVFVGLQGGWPERALADADRLVEGIGTGSDTVRFGRGVIDGAFALLDGEAKLGGERLRDALAASGAVDNGRSGIMPAFVWLFLGDFTRATEVARRAITALRDLGMVAPLAGSMPLLAGAEIGARLARDASTTVADGLELVRSLGYENDEAGLVGVRARVAAFQGREEECRASAEEAMRRGIANGVGWATFVARLALAELELGLGNPRETIEHLEQLEWTPFPPAAALATPDYVDAALRIGEPERAAARVERFAEWALVSEGRLVPGMLARCRAMLSADGDAADRLFREALEHHADDVPAYERARTQLAHGERLRRERRKTDARTQLRAALDVFDGLGAALWAERARGELRATGETARKRDASTIDDLTPQELRIASLVAAGASNRDVAAQIFVSPKTVEYHLRKVFLKLGVASRIELARIPLAMQAQGPD
jgi:DNA-binding CsgD family transcriptional regulator/tetratricopeptide (TPR) repeat protein